MNPLDIRRKLAAFAELLKARTPLREDQFQYLSEAFSRIADGEDANEVLGLKYKRGQKKSDAKARQNWSVVMHMIAALIDKDEGEVAALSVDEACEKVMPIAQSLFGDPTGKMYDAVYIRKVWYKPEYAHLRAVYRNDEDADFPY